MEKQPITSGIINKDLWEKANIKIMFVLKESYGGLWIKDENGEEKPSYSISAYINNKGAKGRTFKTLGQWANALNNYNSNNIDDCLKATAIINIIDVNRDKSSTSCKDLNNFFLTNDRYNEIMKQIKSINPQVIIFGNTYWLFKNIKDFNLPKLGRNVDYAGVIENTNTPLDGITVYNGYHPSYWGQKKYGGYNNPQTIAEIIKKISPQLFNKQTD